MFNGLKSKVSARIALSALAVGAILGGTAVPAQAYDVAPRAYYQWDGYKTCYRMEYRTYHWWEDPFNNRDGLYPVYTVARSYCGR